MVLSGLIGSLMVWGGSIRVVFCIFLIMGSLFWSFFNFIMFEGWILLFMVYLSGLSVIFIYLSSLDLWSGWGFSVWFFGLSLIGAWLMISANNFFLSGLNGCSFLACSISGSLSVSALLVALAFLISALCVSSTSIIIRGL
uniref:NADH dehydrogenase subunit 6 n=1 Tax=Paratenuisentis ambiguus TaxID=185730 RepID=K3W3Y3_PARAB|nr:NADH dehydrogenase subunit 6 [Paratenuisentis ambiguus]CCA94480.2 NADH dehydrogenase subunit 6 [Paratenuisentis ambiguus]